MTDIDIESILTEQHALESVWSSQCDYDDEVRCTCDWKGVPRDYATHLLVALGFEDRVILRWRQELGRPIMVNARAYLNAGKSKSVEPEYSEPTLPEVTDIQREDYLNIFRAPKAKRKITRDERKTGALANAG